MPTGIFPTQSHELADARRKLAPEIHPAKTKQLIAVATAHVTQCPYYIRRRIKVALRHGTTLEELMEASWVAAEMRAGGA